MRARIGSSIGPRSNGQLVFMTRPRTGAKGLDEVARAVGAPVRPLFGLTPAQLRSEASRFQARTGTRLPDLSGFYHVLVPGRRVEALRDRLLRLEVVEAAYVKPRTEHPVVLGPRPRSRARPPSETPEFTGLQAHLDAAPGGIEARYAWTLPGGGGASVRIVDVERAWRFTHEDLLEHQGGVIGGSPPDDVKPRNHGTAATGVIGGDRNAFGVTGISFDADVRGSSIMIAIPPFWVVENTAWAIWRSARALRQGDIILLELHRPGPRFDFQPREDQKGYIAVEWWPCDFAAILYATRRGVLVVEAAGNGQESLDDTLYDAPGPGFPSGWRNAFRRGSRDSGAVLVGAGAPPPGTHGHNWGADRSRLRFSNHGTSVDVQGWGREVTTCGYGDLQGGSNEDRWYTNQFAGTSSASAMVAGALASVQGILRAAGKAAFSPLRAREACRATGSPQQAGQGLPVTQRIGARPNLRQLVSFGFGRVTHLRRRGGKQRRGAEASRREHAAAQRTGARQPVRRAP